MPLIFAAPPPVTVAVEGRGDLPVGRIFCVGRNYAAHAAEMGNEAPAEAPFYFTKSPGAVMASGGTLRYPQATSDLHHEVELVVALGPEGTVMAAGVGLDMTRRDLQAAAKDRNLPWDVAKDFDGSAVLAPMRAIDAVEEIEPWEISLTVNGALRQSGNTRDLIWSVPALLEHLATLYPLRPGDLLMTGTPAGVGAVEPGDRIEAGIDTLPGLTLDIGAPL